MSKSISNTHLDILDKNRQRLLQKLIPYTQGFVLGGGTALALQLMHRKSLDFDFFSPSQIPKKLLEKISQEIKIKNIVVDTKDELTFFTDEGIKITFLNYPFGHYDKNLKLENGLSVFSVQEIALQKAYAIGRRGEYRDYFDLYSILNGRYINLSQIITGAKKIYQNVFDEKIFLEQLVYFGDMSNFDIIPGEHKTMPKPEVIKQFFEKLVKLYI